MAEHLYTYINPTSEKDLDRVCRLLERDGVIAYPMDHNWAFGCDAGSVKALDRIRRLKPTHPKDRPFSLICSDISMAANVATIDNNQYRVLKKCWPGPYTVILKRARNLVRQIKDKRQVVGVRIPESPLIRDLVTRLGKPLATTSVPELADGEIPKFGYQIIEEFGHGIDLLMDLGDELPGLESTVIDFSEDEPVVVRPGVGDPEQFGG
jgi:tRNA threonylcarbamoyl adenosine modification protein (Sua5/YciO/YrdC/YwlC family)